MDKVIIINALIKKNNYKKYLEIGVFKKGNFNSVLCESKKCVDPDKNSNADFIMTSDDFFVLNKEKFDIILIDGLHHREQVYKDILNSLNILNDNGVIVCHDILPITELEQRIPISKENANSWTGDCWKAWLQFLMFDNLEMYVIDTDHGVGIIQKNKLVKSSIGWDFFQHNKKFMQVFSIEDFNKKILS